MTATSGTMLDLWRPPPGAGDPVGCLATTYTFASGLFDEQCLARFLDIESEPSREDLAYVLERESRLGSVYAGVLVDHTQAGVEHSLRWDILPVRIRAGKQHAKISLLVWSRHVRIIVASANLTEPGYRSNHEVTGAVEITPSAANEEILADAIDFLRRLIARVPAAASKPPMVLRVEKFLREVERKVKGWTPSKRADMVRQHLVFSLPAGNGAPGRSALDDTLTACRRRGPSPHTIWVASPFFDLNDGSEKLTTYVCKSMARGLRRDLCFCVPVIETDEKNGVPRLAAPKCLIEVPVNYGATVTIRALPNVDPADNRRAWHAKMLWLEADEYSALMIGSSNFTCAGMGMGHARNAEANLLTVVDYEAYRREIGKLDAVFPEMDVIEEAGSAEWMGASIDRNEEEMMKCPPVPDGFLSATFVAGATRKVVLALDPEELPADWQISACGSKATELLSTPLWVARGRPAVADIGWEPEQPPERLMVVWEGKEAFWPLNVDDSRALPPPKRLENMTSDDLLWIWSATDPGAAFRTWARRQHPDDSFDPDLDTATPPELDPLRRHDLEATFLHRIRRRARVLAQVRANLQRPVWGRQALDWRLRGLVGVEVLANRLLREFAKSDAAAGEALLSLADFLIVLREVAYEQEDGSLTTADFEEVFRPFVRELAETLSTQVEASRPGVARDVMEFWERVVTVCRK